eukprot:5058788-Amphidinium_carterae.1
MRNFLTRAWDNPFTSAPKAQKLETLHCKSEGSNSGALHRIASRSPLHIHSKVPHSELQSGKVPASPGTLHRVPLDSGASNNLLSAKLASEEDYINARDVTIPIAGVGSLRKQTGLVLIWSGETPYLRLPVLGALLVIVMGFERKA